MREVELGLRPWLGDTQAREPCSFSCTDADVGPHYCDGEFDPGSGQTLAAHLRHASRTRELRLPSGGRVSNTWATCPAVGDTRGKPRLRPHTAACIAAGGEKPLSSWRRGLRRISWLVGSWPTKAVIRSWSERTASHTGTETRPGLLREAAVREFSHWAQA